MYRCLAGDVFWVRRIFGSVQWATELRLLVSNGRNRGRLQPTRRGLLAKSGAQCRRDLWACLSGVPMSGKLAESASGLSVEHKDSEAMKLLIAALSHDRLNHSRPRVVPQPLGHPITQGLPLVRLGG